MLYARKKFKVGLVSLKKGDNCVPIGLVYLGTYLKKHGINVEIIDSNFIDPLEKIKDNGFDLIGISAMSVHYGKALRLAKGIKGIARVPIVIGGVHISTLPVSFEPCFDHAILGEGENAMLTIAKYYHNNIKPEKIIEGISFDNLDNLPQPDWDLINKNYHSYLPSMTFGEFGREGSILTSRGCPYQCRFCSTTKFWKKVRFHSPEYVADMIENLIKKYNVNLIQIWDDLFTINLPRLVKIRELLLKRRLLTKNIKFNCQPRPNLVNDELCELLKDMNVTMGIFGFESGSDKVLQYLKRSTVTVENNKNAIETFRKHKLKVQGSVVLGSPTETIEDMYKTLDFVNFAIKNKVQRLWIFVLTPFPSTEMWEIAKKKGKVCDKEFDWDSLACQNIENPMLLDDEIDRKEFKKIYNKILNKVISLRYNKIFSFVRHSPLDSFNYLLQNKYSIFNLLTTKQDV